MSSLGRLCGMEDDCCDVGGHMYMHSVVLVVCCLLHTVPFVHGTI